MGDNLSLTDNPLPEPQPRLEQVETIAPQPVRRDPIWSGFDVLMIAVVALFSMFVFGTLIGIGYYALAHHTPSANSTKGLRILLLAQFLSYVVVLWFMHHLVAVRYRARFDEAVHWYWPNNWFSWLAAGMGLAIAVELISRLLPLPRTLPIDRYFQSRSAAWMMSIFGISMAPLIEELFFRGFLFPVLARRFSTIFKGRTASQRASLVGLAIAAIITALAFALLHSSQLAGAWAPLLMLFIVGLTFTIMRIVTNSVAPGFLMHVGYNLTLFTLLYVATDHFRHMEKMLQQ